MNMDGGMADTKMISGSGDGAEGRRHRVKLLMGELTKAVDGKRPTNGVPYIPFRLGQ